jgi:Rod binding domain-containing protein
MTVGKLGILSKSEYSSKKIFESNSELEQFKEEKSSKEIEKAAKDFEGILLKQMFEAMWQSVPKGGMFGTDLANDFYHDLYHEALATSIAEGRSIGIREVLCRELKTKMETDEQSENKNNSIVKPSDTSQH